MTTVIILIVVGCGIAALVLVTALNSIPQQDDGETVTKGGHDVN